MPTYEYRCAAGHTFERFEKMTAEPVASCPECGARAQRVISGGAGLLFKGSGFYITDYGKDGKGRPKDADAATPAEKSAPAPADGGTAGSKAGGSATPSSSSDTPSSSPGD